MKWWQRLALWVLGVRPIRIEPGDVLLASFDPRTNPFATDRRIDNFVYALHERGVDVHIVYGPMPEMKAIRRAQRQSGAR